MKTVTADREWISALPTLGLSAPDAEWIQSGLAELDRADVETVHSYVARLRARVGALSERVNVLADEATDHPHGTGYLQALALMAAAPAVHASMTGRGISPEVAWASLADFGQQLRIHRIVHGRSGFGASDWVIRNWNGCLVWLGRLQFTLEDDPHLGWVLGCHIPETGPLASADVDASLRQAAAVAVPAFAEFDVRAITCSSWLLDPNLVRRLPAESNVASFARRFTPYGTPRPGRRDALFFGFHREVADDVAVDYSALPRTSSLQRAAADLLAGEGPRIQPGWMPLPPT